MKKLTPPPVTDEARRELLEAALTFRAQKPWAYMGDGETFCWEDPVTGRLRIGVVLGIGGTMFGLAVYRGKLGMHSVLKTVLGEDYVEPDIREGMEVDAVRVEFTKKGDLQPEDIAWLKAAGFKPDKGNGPAWPCFRSFVPGFTEWFLDQAETETMTADLRRVTGFARVLQANPGLMDTHPFGTFPFWPRQKPVTEPLTAAELQWHPLTVPPPPVPPEFTLTPDQIAQLLALPQKPQGVWEAGAVYTMDAIGEPPRPFYTRVGLVVDRETGFVLAFQVGSRGLCLEYTAAQAAVDGMLKIGFRPKVLHLMDDTMRDAFEPVATQLDIQVTSGEELLALIEALQSMMAGMGRGGF